METTIQLVEEEDFLEQELTVMLLMIKVDQVVLV